MASAAAQPSLAFFVFGLVGQTFVFGLYTLLVFLSTRLLLRRQRNKTRTTLVITTLFMYILSTLYWIFSMVLVGDHLGVVKQALRDLSKGKQPPKSSDTLVDLSPIVGAVILLNYVISDAVAVWRTRLVCHHALRKFLFVPLGFVVLTAIALVALIALRIVDFLGMMSLPAGVIDGIQLAMLGLSIASILASTALIGGTAIRNRRDPFATETRNSRVLSLNAVYLTSGFLLLISMLIRLPDGTLGTIYGPVAIQIAGAYPSALLLLVEQGNNDASGAVLEKTMILFPKDTPSPTNSYFKSKSLNGNNPEPPRSLIPARVEVDLDIDNIKPADVELGDKIATKEDVTLSSKPTDLSPSPSFRKARLAVMSTEFALPTPPQGSNPAARKMVTFDVDVAPEGAVTPDIGTVAMPVPALGNPNNALPALEMDLRPLPESEPAQLVIAQPRPIVANTQPPPVISEPEQPEMTQAQLPLYAPKPSRVPIAVGALEYYQKRQQLGMMQTGPVGGQHGRNASQSTVASLAAGVMVGGPPGIAMGGQVVMAQGRDHPFPLQSQRNADAALPMTPTTPRTMMMVKERNQATLDALDLDLNLVLGSLEARAQEDMAGTPMTIPLDIPEQVEVSRVSIQSVDDLRRTGEETPAEAGVGLAFYVSSLSPDVETLPQSAPASPIAEKSNLLPPKQVATEPVIIVKEPIPTLLKPPKNEQKQRSSIAVAKLATFPTVPSRSRTPTSSRAVTPTPSVLSNSTESSQASSDRPDFRSQPANPQRSRSQTHARKMNQFPVTPTRSRVQTPTSSRAPTPTMSVTSSSDDDIRARTVAHRRSRSAGQMQMLRPNLVFAGPRPPSVAGSDASSSGPVVGSRQRSKSLTRRPNQAPSRPQSPTASVAGSLTSELSTRQRPSAHERTKSLRTNEFALAPPPGSAPAPAQAPKVPILSPTLSAVSDFIGPKHKRNKSQPRTLLPPPAVDISAPLSPGAIELEEERAQRKKLSRFSDG